MILMSFIYGDIALKNYKIEMWDWFCTSDWISL